MSTFLIDITLCHGSSNTFVMVGDPTQPFTLPEQHLADFARKICTHELTMCDGLLIVEQTPERASSQGADSQMRMFNPDGSESELCGNGMRCVARETMQVVEKSQINILASNKLYFVNKEADLAPKVFTVSVDMGQPTFVPKQIPINHSKEVMNESIPVFHNDLLVSILGMPNPHVVVMVNEPKMSMDLLVEMGEIANDPLTRFFPRGANINFIQKLGKNTFFVATYERGVGLTKACGSGMTASSIVACKLGEADFDQDLIICNKGGYVRINVSEDERSCKASMMGNATYIMKAEVAYQPDAPLPDVFDDQIELSEEKNYQAVILDKEGMLLKAEL